MLLETARAGGLRKAEVALGLTQPTIGKKIDRLEQMAGTKLLYRTKAGVSLTPAGESFFRIAEEMERLTQKVGPDSVLANNGLTGRLRIAATDGMAGYWLPHRLRRFHREYPGITLDMHCIDATTEVNLTKREADITVMYSYPTDPDVVVLSKASMVLAPFCTKGFLADWGQPESIEDVLNFPVCAHYMHYRKEGDMKPWAEMLERHDKVIYRTASSLVLGNVVKMGLGISLQPLGVLDREDDAVYLDLDGFSSHLPFFLVCHKDIKDVPPVRAMIRYLNNSLFRDDGLGSPSKKPDGPPPGNLW